MTQNYQSLDFYSLRDLYKSRKSNPTEVIKRILERISEVDDSGIWISKVPESDVLHATNCLADQDPDSMALYGLPFAIKDNIDFSGLSRYATLCHAGGPLRPQNGTKNHKNSRVQK